MPYYALHILTLYKDADKQTMTFKYVTVHRKIGHNPARVNIGKRSLLKNVLKKAMGTND